MPRHLSAISLLTCAILTACTTTTTTPTPTPSPTCTPEAGGTPYPCNQHDHDQLATKEKLYLEAETVYRKFFAEEERIYRAGGTNKPTKTILETTTGDFLLDSMAIYRSLKKNRTHLAGGALREPRITRVPGVSSGGSVVTLDACTDGSATWLVADGKRARHNRGCSSGVIGGGASVPG